MSKVEEFLELVDGLTSLSPEGAEKVRRKYPLDRRGRVNKKRTERRIAQSLETKRQRSR